MKNTIAILMALVVGFVMANLLVSARLREAHRAELSRAEAEWQAEKAELESRIQRANGAQKAGRPVNVLPEAVRVTNAVSAAEILERLRSLRAGTNSPRNVRLIIHEFESLAELAAAALPGIREFLGQNVDVDYDGASRRDFRDGRMPTEFAFPPSLRLGLLEIAKRIGGEAGEQVLAETLTATRRGAEVAYTAYSLQELAPNKYRDAALGAARDLLARKSAPGTTSQLDRFERDYLYGVLNFFGDSSYVATAQAQMIQSNGSVDAVAVRYLQQTLGPQAVSLAAQAWQDPRLAPDQKEPLARVALTYAGLDPRADQFYQTAINDPNLPPKHRKNLIEDLNEAGFADPKNLTASDLPLIQKRMTMVEQLAPNAMDQVNADAFKEAYKDLVKMQHSVQKAGK
jgi:hypothetical protein